MLKSQNLNVNSNVKFLNYDSINKQITYMKPSVDFWLVLLFSIWIFFSLVGWGMQLLFIQGSIQLILFIIT